MDEMSARKYGRAMQGQEQFAHLLSGQCHMGEINVPKVVFLYATDGPHLTDLAPDADDLDAHLRALLDDHVLIVCKLGRGRVGVPLDLARDQLEAAVSAGSRRWRSSKWQFPGQHTCADTNSFRGPAFAKKPW